MIVNGTNLSMIRGDSDSLIVGCRDGETERSFTPGDAVTLTVASPLAMRVPVLQKRVTEFTDGKAIFLFQPADTAALAPRDYVYDVQLDTVDGYTVTIVEPSVFTLREDVTL